MVTARYEFARDVRTGVGGQSDTGCGGTASSGQNSLCESARGGVAGNSSGCRCALAGPRIGSNYRTLQCVPQAWRHAVFVRTMIVEILVEFGRNSVFHSLADRVSGEASP